MAKMDSDRPHHRELFICFTSRLSSSSSSSMKLSSKPSFSPGREKFKEPTLAFSSSMNRRLRSYGSMKGGQSSPMFPTGSKKRGGGFENAEPSSPKVTCIGQVRVRGKKNGKRRNEDGILKQERNQKWPLTICEALRAFGAEFNCFLPCGGRSSSCSARERAEKRRKNGSCGAVFARWLMALQEGEEEEKRSEIEIVVGGGGEEKNKEEESVSICIPPKNALLLMRCRSEPLRMSALANRFWDSPIQQDDEEEEEEEEDEEEDESEDEERYEEVEEIYEGVEDVKVEQEEEHEEVKEVEQVKVVVVEEQAIVEAEMSQNEEIPEKKLQIEETPEEKLQIEETTEGLLKEQEEMNSENAEKFEIEEEKTMVIESTWEEIEELESSKSGNEEKEEEVLLLPEEIEGESRISSSSDTQVNEKEAKLEGENALKERAEKITEEEKETELVIETYESCGTETVEEDHEEEKQSTETESQGQHVEEKDGEEEERECAKVLPDCLLMMMCEPKLSMEVSKETWVCSTDFIKHRLSKQVIRTNGADEGSEKVSIDSNPAKQQEEKTPEPASSMAYEPLVLTRCKSEPLRSSARLVPEACCWKNSRQIETHRFAVGAAGIGV